MSILLFVVGALAFVVGTAMIGFGIPDKEFSVGSTLIISGMTAAIGGLIIVGLGIAVSQLQRLTDALATRTPIRPNRQFDTFDPVPAPPARSQAAAARVPFPPKTKPDTRSEAQPLAQQAAQPAAFAPREPMAPEQRLEEPTPDYAAPTLPNPDEPPVTAADEAFLSPLQPVETSVRRSPPPPFFGAPASDTDHDDADPRETQAETNPDEHEDEPAPRKSNTYFDAMWPAEPKLPEATPPEAKPTDVDEEPDAFAVPPEEQTRAVAILKSGVVDGMGYTLYVDGSIEAELPQGTLRFASINELRSHLEKTS